LDANTATMYRRAGWIKSLSWSWAINSNNVGLKGLDEGDEEGK